MPPVSSTGGGKAHRAGFEFGMWNAECGRKKEARRPAAGAENGKGKVAVEELLNGA